MNKEQLNRIINLIKKTGDKLVVLDQTTEASFILMDLKDYEKLILAKSEVKDLTEDELLDKINRDIAIWKVNQSEASDIELDNISSYDKIKKNQNDQASQISSSSKEDKFYIEPEEE